MTIPTTLMSRGTSRVGVGVDGDLPQDLPSTRVGRPQYGATYHVRIHGVDRVGIRRRARLLRVGT